MAAKVLKLRRGVEERRKSITPAEGEIIITTDERRMYIGDNQTPGGNCIRSSLRTFEWDFSVVAGQMSYSPDSSLEPFHSPDNGLYFVFFGGVKLLKSDYSINSTSNTITLTSAPTDEDTEVNLSVSYIGE